MSRYNNYSSNRYGSNWKSYVGPVLLGLVVVLGITWAIMEFACSRTFVGTLVSREAPITFTYDEERVTVTTDDEGETHISTTGDDETIAYKKYLLTFYANGEMRTVTAGSSRGRSPHVHREDLALAALAANDVEPPHYTYAKMNAEYLVKVSGWLLDGTVEDLTLLDSIKAE